MRKKVRNVIIIGAAGRDFHNFNSFFRHNKNYNVVAFTAEQIPGIDDRMYPKELAGEDLYPKGIRIYPESKLAALIKDFDGDYALVCLNGKYGFVNKSGADCHLWGR